MAHNAALRPCLLTAMLLLLHLVAGCAATPRDSVAAGAFSPADIEGLPSVAELQRQTSITVTSELSAVEFERASPTTTITSSTLEMLPNYQGQFSGAAWSIYRFGMAEPAENKPLRLYWGSAPSEGLYCGLADFENSRWRWIKPEDPALVEPGELTPHVADDGSVLVAIVLLGNEQARLDGLRFGADAPFPVLLANPQQGPAPLDVTLDASESHNPQAGVFVHAWDLDGNGSYEVNTGASAETSFQLDRLDGSYAVGLRITADELDYEARATITVEGSQFTIPPAESFVDFKPEGTNEEKWLFNCYAPLPPFNDDNRCFQTVYFALQADDLLLRTNQLRSGLGLNALSWDPHLELLAQAHSRHMALREFFDHTDLYLQEPADRLARADSVFWTMCAENIFAGNYTGELTYEQMVNSQGHYDNAVLPGLTHMGVGCYQHDGSTYGTYWTMLFIAYDGDPNQHDWLEPQEVE